MATLSKDKQQMIDSMIEGIPLLSGGVNYPDVGLITLAEKLGASVVIGDLSTVGKNVAGAITYEDPSAKSGATIFIHSEASTERQLFTLAHELGHFMLHEGAALRTDDTDYASDSSLQETEANYFAASLLMPKGAVLHFIRKKKNYIEIAELFRVSPSAMKNRIEWIIKNG